MRIASTLCLFSALLTVGCPRPVTRVDGGVDPTDGGPDIFDDAQVDSGGMFDAGALDAGPPDAGPLDGGPPPGSSWVAEAPEVLREGSGGLLLRGVVLTPTGALDPGEVLVVGDTIMCVAADCSAAEGASTVTLIDTHSVISPGLIDAHNHLTYNFLTEWVPAPAMLYDNRYVWADEAAYEAHIAPFADNRSQLATFCPAAKWGELRSLIHGTTTVMGQSFNRACINRLVRNADHHHGLGHDHMRTSIASVRGITDAQSDSLVASFTDADRPTTRYAVHMTEGLMGNNLELEFDSFAGRDTRTNRHMGVNLFAAADGSYRGVATLIHSMILSESQLQEVVDTGSHMVWSPSSNLVLYGATAPIARILELEIPVGLGPDWTVSGEDEMLSEMRFARAYAEAESIDALTPERIWQMATAGGADVLGLAHSIGTIEVGQRADLVVFGRASLVPYQAVLHSRAEDVRLVLIDGAGYYGDVGLEARTSVNGDCEMIDACGNQKFICLANTPGSTSATARAEETVEDVRNQLVTLLDGYGRSDLNELIACE